MTSRRSCRSTSLRAVALAATPIFLWDPIFLSRSRFFFCCTNAADRPLLLRREAAGEASPVSMLPALPDGDGDSGGDAAPFCTSARRSRSQNSPISMVPDLSGSQLSKSAST